MADTAVIGSRWADEPIDDDDYVTSIPTRQQEQVVHKPKDGERVTTETRTDPDTGKKQRVIRTYKVEKKLISKNAIERRKWTKYGQSTKDGPGLNPATTVVTDEVLMQFLTKDHDAIPEDNPLTKAQKEGRGGVLRCRFCQDNHFSAKCPFKDSGLPPDYMAPKELEEPKKPIEMESKVYQAPKGRGRGETMGAVPKKDYTIRVSNLPESMSETDMQDLCNPFGKTERIFLAKDRSTGVCKGFAFVTYQTKESACKALALLNGYGYDHLILNVEWSKPANN